MKKCIFLDRDGTINQEKDYLYKLVDLSFEKGALKGLELLNKTDYLIIVVTNQSGVARGYYEEGDVQKLNGYMKRIVEGNKGRIDAFYYCPHHPEGSEAEYKKACKCRKPESGMFLEAKKDYDIDFENSVMVGDKLADVEAGLNLGMRSVLLKTGHGTKEIKSLAEKGYSEKVEVFENLYEFAENLVSGIEKNIKGEEISDQTSQGNKNLF